MREVGVVVFLLGGHWRQREKFNSFFLNSPRATRLEFGEFPTLLLWGYGGRPGAFGLTSDGRSWFQAILFYSILFFFFFSFLLF